jgi:predicted metal-binding membrane protein
VTLPGNTRPDSLRRKDFWTIAAALLAITALAWLYLIVLASRMGNEHGGSMGAMSQLQPWSPLEFLMLFIMWAVMMIGMMVPTASRAVLIYAAVARQAAKRGNSLPATGWFIAGYILVWTGFSLGATAFQAGLNNVGLLSPMMASASPWLVVTLLLAAGCYQLTPWKEACLKHCQSPANYLAGKFKPGISGAVALGVRHGSYCLGCCWVLMSLLFVGGVMNLIWIATITFFVLLEKLSPIGTRLRNVSGWLMIGSAAVYSSSLMAN